jgi:hypothetical protein
MTEDLYFPEDDGELKTSEQWQKEHPSPKIIDPDGWDRVNFQWSWYQERITWMEFQYRLIESTCQWASPP